MNYWLALFSGTSWQEFQDAGAKITGFPEGCRNRAGRIRSKDILLCYVTRVMRWVGALEVIGTTSDERRIFSDADFPVRFEVKPAVILPPEHGVPMDVLENRVYFFRTNDRGKFRGFLRRSPSRFHRNEDGALIHKLLRGAKRKPVERPVNPRLLRPRKY